jgi:hypothetical protein
MPGMSMAGMMDACSRISSLEKKPDVPGKPMMARVETQNVQYV